MKTAIVTGAPGQDAYYLSKLLLDKNYQVVCTYRYSSTAKEERFKEWDQVGHENFKTEVLDITDPTGCFTIVEKYKPNEIYNLAAASHVGESFKNPYSVFTVNTQGVVNLLEAIRQKSPSTRFLQCSTSEMWGSNYSTEARDLDLPHEHEDKAEFLDYGGMVEVNKYQDENTPFSPNSPYAAAKLAAHNIVRIYRESYGLFACCSITHNHECFYENTPLIIKDRYGWINTVYIRDLIPNRKDISHDSSQLSKSYLGIDLTVWDGESWQKLKFVSRKKINLLNKEDQKVCYNGSTRGICCTTPNHNFIVGNKKIPVKNLTKNETKLNSGGFPDLNNYTEISLSFAKFLGFLVGDGYVNDNAQIRLANISEKYRSEFFDCARKSGYAKSFKVIDNTSDSTYGTSQYIDLKPCDSVKSRYLRDLIYHKKTKHKRVPEIILNSRKEIREAFLDSYYKCDGLKNYDYRSYKSNSPLLLQGLILIDPQRDRASVRTQLNNGKFYGKIDYPSKNIKDYNLYHHEMVDFDGNDVNQHVYDIEVESGKVMAGIGRLIVGNSPMRGEAFVTRKITKWIAKFEKWKRDNGVYNIEPHFTENKIVFGNLEYSKLRLGNISAVRDWSHAADMVKGMHLIMQHNKPEDFVLASGIGHSVEDFLKEAFACVGITNYNDYWKVDPKFYRPCEVEYLQGRADKAKEILGWSQEIAFKQLVKRMIENDIQRTI